MRPTALAAAALLAAACSPTADFHADRVCATAPQQAFPGVQSSTGLPDTLPAQRVTFDMGSGIPDLHAKGVKDAKVLFRELRLKASDSSQGANGSPTQFIQTLTVALEPPPGSTLPSKQVLAYVRPAGAAPTELVIPGDGTNLVDYLQAGQLTAVVSGQGDPGQLPRTPWTAAATFCSEVDVTVDYLEAI
ncbi:MAG TPA: hypothetical protein VFP65_19775 [Anaeromyxobacteraceae bacterium]|nr:hypothetical protein [Anaeromyxobacteraceae bacterium]